MTVTIPVPRRAVVERAFELLRDGQWVRYEWGRTSDGVRFEGCLVGALMEASVRIAGEYAAELEIPAWKALKNLPGRAVDAVRQTLDIRGLERGTSIVEWNDRICEGEEEVLEVLKETIVNLPLEEAS